MTIFKLYLIFIIAFSVQAKEVQGTFKINLRQEPTTLNPLSSTDLYSSNVQAYIMESLLTRDIETYEWKPVLALKWKISKDNMTYTFWLRKGVKWQDGTDLTVEDVIFSLKAIQDPQNKYKTAQSKPYYEGIASVKKTGDNQVTFKMKNNYFKNFSIVAGLKIVPKHIYEDTSKKNIRKLNKTIVGSGPYRLKQLKRGKYLILEFNKNWWGRNEEYYKNQYNFKKIMMRFIQDSTVALQRMEKGGIDYNALEAEDYVKKTTSEKWKSKLFKVKYKNLSPVSYSFIGWNLKNPILNSKNNRKALYLLINRKLMIEKFRFGFDLPATGPWYQQSPYANKKVQPVAFNPKLALKLLRSEGWKDTDGDNILDKVINGKKTSFRITILEPSKQFLKYLTIFKEDAKKAGVDIRIKQIEWNTFIKLLNEKKFDACRLGWGGGSIDNDPKQIWHSTSSRPGGSNFISYNNPVVDKLIDKGRLITNKKKRIKVWQKIYKLIANDYPYAFLFNAKYNFYGVSRKIKREKDTYKYGIGSDYWSMLK